MWKLPARLITGLYWMVAVLLAICRHIAYSRLTLTSIILLLLNRSLLVKKPFVCRYCSSCTQVSRSLKKLSFQVLAVPRDQDTQNHTGGLWPVKKKKQKKKQVLELAVNIGSFRSTTAAFTKPLHCMPSHTFAQLTLSHPCYMEPLPCISHFTMPTHKFLLPLAPIELGMLA